MGNSAVGSWGSDGLGCVEAVEGKIHNIGSWKIHWLVTRRRWMDGWVHHDGGLRVQCVL